MVKFKQPYFVAICFSTLFALAGAADLSAQISASAYRVLGQPDLRLNGLNLVQGVELNSPAAIALDGRLGPVHLYVSDTRNSRVMAWEDARSYQNGDPPALVLGQPGPMFSNPLGIGSKGFNAPAGLAVDPFTGNLYVADFGNNRVLRFPAPFANPTRVEPDTVYGQPNFTTGTAGVSKSSLNRPRAVAFDAAGNLWVADSGNHRILRFNAGVLDSLTPPDADMVIGQKDFTSGTANRGGGANGVSASGLDTPSGLAFDQQGNLYVADSNNTRVLKFAAPLSPTSPDPAATAVWGQADFRSRGVPGQATPSSLAGPVGLAIDNAGNLYVAVPGDNRVLVFSLAGNAGGAAQSVLGQSDFATTTANSGAFPSASTNTLAGPFDVKVDSSGNIFIADSNNNRVVLFPAGTKSATRLWGQADFSSNGANQIKAGSINAAHKMAIDYSRTPFALYVSDTNNHRVLGWKDSTRFRNGDPADLVIGQPDFSTAIANIDTRASVKPSRTSLAAPTGIVVDPTNGTLYVADTANNRVLRYPSPVSQTGRIAPDAVIGQVDFTSSNSAAVTAASLRTPVGLALGPDGNLFVADSGNNRVLEFAAGAGTGATAIRVYGQPNFNSSLAQNRVSAQTLSAPQGVYVDVSFDLYVTDTAANRLLIFPNTQSAPAAGTAAAFVVGQGSFDGTAGTGTNFKTPTDVSVNGSGNIFVVDSGNNRVLIFPSLVFLPITSAVASAVVGQRDLSGTAPNWNSTNGLATPEGLFAPVGLYLDRQDTLYVGDTGNNRLLHFLKPAFVVNAATLQTSVPVGLGGLVNLIGAGLANDTATAPEMPWPTELAQREVVVNDEIKATLSSIDQSQARLQFPSTAPLGTQRIAVRVSDTGELVAGGAVIVASAAPGLFTVSQDGKGQAQAVNQDGRPNNASNPAARGSTITLFGTGQGQVSPPVADGTPAPGDLSSNTVAVPTSDGRTCLTTQPSICVSLGTSSFGEIQYSGLAPGSIGMWQITIKIPQDVPPGNAVPVRALINATPSNVVTIAVR
jgi:uncharacterized protein (TIGR03437 family)